MAEEIEVPTEQLHETLQERAEGRRAKPEEPAPGWVERVALSAALFAVFAAISALLAGHHANEAMLEQMQATDQWAYYQAKGIKASVLETKLAVLAALDREPSGQEAKRIEAYREEQREIEDKAHELERSSREHMGRHDAFAKAVTFFQVTIALSAISVLSRKKLLWFASLALGAVGIGLLINALI